MIAINFTLLEAMIKTVRCIQKVITEILINDRSSQVIE